ncbi:MAG: hypothetical protein AAFV53_23515 [Myxococcota bacterium]
MHHIEHFRRSATGEESAIRDALQQQCHDAVSAPDVDGLPRLDIEPCVVTCGLPGEASLKISVVSGSPGVVSALEGRRAAMRRCVSLARQAGEQVDTTIRIAYRIRDGSVDAITAYASGAPQLTRCLERNARFYPGMSSTEVDDGVTQVRISLQTP